MATTPADSATRAVGCLIGSAYGDSLGASVEFDSLSTIRQRYGVLGVTELLAGAELEATVRQLIDDLVVDTDEATYSTRFAVRGALEAPRDGDPGTAIDGVIGGGGGWMGHDALAIGLYAVLCAPDDPVDAVRIAVNHSGDSDSTGCIAGAIAGAMFGPAPFDAALAAQQVALEHDALLRDLGGRLAALRDVGTGPAAP